MIMEFKKLKVILLGTLWDIRNIEIEGIDVKERWEEEDGNKGWVEIEDFPVSEDEVLDVFLYVNAPNGTKYDVEIKGQLVNGSNYDIEYAKSYKVVKNGTLYINISEKIGDLISNTV